MKLVVDKLPSGCGACLFFVSMGCLLLKKPAPDSFASRLKGCPLAPIVSDKKFEVSEDCEAWEFVDAINRRSHLSIKENLE